MSHEHRQHPERYDDEGEAYEEIRSLYADQLDWMSEWEAGDR